MTERATRPMELDATLVRRLLADQFPQWSQLPVRPVEHQGNDNRTFRVGEGLLARLPSAEGYAAAIAKESDALPFLAHHLTVPIPQPVATGRPSEHYPWPWSVRRWIDGTAPEADTTLDRMRFARDVGTFLTELHAVPSDRGPRAGSHSSFRGCHPSAYSAEVQHCLEVLRDVVDTDACRRIWSEASGTVCAPTPVWFHGDLTTGNLLVRDGRLAAVIDFGVCGVGDPACDLALAWTYFRDDDRQAFMAAMSCDDGTWLRARAWALWKALITVAQQLPAPGLELQRDTLAELLADS